MSTRVLPLELQKKAVRDLNEVPNRIRADLDHLKEWMDKQPHITFRKDDQWLLTFLRGCKFSLERTKEKLKEFYVLRSGLPEIFNDRDPLLTEIQEILSMGLHLPLPKTANECGPRITLTRFKDPTNISHLNVMKVCVMIADVLLMEDDNFIISGPELFLDYSHFTAKHLTIDLGMLQKVMACLQHGYPVRPQGFHCYNVPTLAEATFNLCKPFLVRKLQDRIHFYSEKNVENLYNNIPLSVLPKEYGGDGPSVEELTVVWKKKVESYRDWFLKDSQYGASEDYLLEKKNVFEQHGIQGSFRKLDLD